MPATVAACARETSRIAETASSACAAAASMDASASPGPRRRLDPARHEATFLFRGRQGGVDLVAHPRDVAADAASPLGGPLGETPDLGGDDGEARGRAPRPASPGTRRSARGGSSGGRCPRSSRGSSRPPANGPRPVRPPRGPSRPRRGSPPRRRAPPPRRPPGPRLGRDVRGVLRRLAGRAEDAPERLLAPHRGLRQLLGPLRERAERSVEDRGSLGERDGRVGSLGRAGQEPLRARQELRSGSRPPRRRPRPSPPSRRRASRRSRRSRGSSRRAPRRRTSALARRVRSCAARSRFRIDAARRTETCRFSCACSRLTDERRCAPRPATALRNRPDPVRRGRFPPAPSWRSRLPPSGGPRRGRARGGRRAAARRR